MIINKVSSPYDETSLNTDSAFRSSLFKINTSFATRGSFTPGDLVDYYSITPLTGNYQLVVTTEGLNLNSVFSTSFTVKITDQIGNVVLTSDLSGPDIFTDSISFYSPSSTQTYYVEIRNTSGQSFNYLSTINPVASAQDTTPPFIIDFNPAVEAAAASTTANVVLTFTEPVVRGSGNVVLRDASGVVIETFAAASSNRIAITGSVLTIDPTLPLANNATYFLEITAGAFNDASGNPYGGLSGYSFTTQKLTNYPTLDYLPDLTPSEMASAGKLAFSTYSQTGASWDARAQVIGSDDGAILHSVYKFEATEGFTFDIFSQSYFDPFLLELFDSAGNAIVANDEADDLSYGTDLIYHWKAPYSGTYYVNASWNQGSAPENKTYALALLVDFGSIFGDEFLVDSELSGSQSDPSIAALNNGGFVVVWHDEGDPSVHRIESQRFNASGEKVGAEFLVSSDPSGIRALPSIASLTNGSFVVTWSDAGGSLGDNDAYAIHGRLFDGTGVPIGPEFRVNTSVVGNQTASAVAGLANGGFVISWTDTSGTLGDASSSSIKAQRFASDGSTVGSEFRVNTTTPGYQTDSEVSALSNGNFVVSWTDQGNSLWSIRAQVVSSLGAKIGDELIVDVQGPWETYGTVTGLTSGGFVVAWDDRKGTLGDGSSYGITAQVFDNSGAPVSSKFLVNTTTFAAQFDPSIAPLSNGGFVISWTDSGGALGDPDLGVLAQEFDNLGTRVGVEFRVNVNTAGWQGPADAATLTNGNLVVAWNNNAPILGDTGSNISARIIAHNDRPQLTAPIADQVSIEDATWSFQVPTDTFSDPNGTALTFSAGLGDGGALPAWLNFDAATRTFSGTPPANFAGDFDLVVTANDGALSVSDNFKLTINPVNDAPAANRVVADQMSLEDSIWSFTVPADTFLDVDNSTLVYNASLGNGAPLPAWLTFDSSARRFSGTPPTNFNGTLDLKITASDGDLSASEAFQLHVSAVNDAPTVTHSIADQTVAEDNSWGFQFAADTFTDVDGDSLSYRATLANAEPLPTWLSFNPSSRTFSGTPPLNFNGSLDVKVTASDAAFSASDTFKLSITPVNDPPTVLNAIPDQSSAEDASWSFSVPPGTFGDVDSPSLTFSASQGDGSALPLWLGFDAAMRTFSGTPPTNFNDSLDLRVTASDGSLSASDTFKLNVTPVNDAPVVLNPIMDQVLSEDSPWTFQVPAGSFSDVDNASLLYGAKLADGSPLPSWVAFDPATITFSGTPPLNFNGNLDIKVIATDGALSADDTFRLAITPVNDAPIAADDSKALVQGQTTNFDAAFLLGNDTDVEADSLTVSGVSNAAHGTVSIDGTSISFTPVSGFTGQAGFDYTVSDGHGGTGNGHVTVNVLANLPPVLGSTDQSLATVPGIPIEVVVKASDPEGDPLTYAPSVPLHGTLSTAGNTFLYTPAAAFVGNDSFTIAVSDGKGGVATQTVEISVVPQPSINDWRLFTSTGFKGEVGGSGSVFGTTGFQDIAVLNVAGEVTFDPSFNRGGDIIRLPGNAAAWEIVRSGSSALLTDGDTFVQIPIGTAGTAIEFDDGPRTLKVDGATPEIGTQAFGTSFQAIAAPADGAALPTGADAANQARLFLAAGVSAAAGGAISVFGTTGNEHVSILSGDVTFDPSFNRGGDSIKLDHPAADFTASRVGSSVFLDSVDTDVHIPVGTSGVALDFGNGDDRVLLYDAAAASIRIGDQLVGFTPAALTAFA